MPSIVAVLNKISTLSIEGLCALYFTAKIQYIELPFKTKYMIEQQEPASFLPWRGREVSYSTFQFCGQYRRIITFPVCYLFYAFYCVQHNNYHTLLQFDVLQCETTCRVRCGFSSIVRFPFTRHCISSFSLPDATASFPPFRYNWFLISFPIIIACYRLSPDICFLFKFSAFS